MGTQETNKFQLGKNNASYSWIIDVKNLYVYKTDTLNIRWKAGKFQNKEWYGKLDWARQQLN